MSKDQGASLVKLLIIGMVCFLALLIYVFVESYTGRHNLANAEKRARSVMIDFQRQGCERGKKDRQENSAGWRTAEGARLRSLAKDQNISYATAETLIAQEPDPDDPPDLVAARKYDKIASAQEERSAINCAEAY